jgi:hypothetical protein
MSFSNFNKPFALTHQSNIMPLCFSIKWWHLQKENDQLCRIVVHKIECTYPNGTQGCSSTSFSWMCHHRKVEFIFHKPKYLNTCNFYKFYEFQAFMFEDGNKVELSPQSNDRIYKKKDFHDCFIIWNHGQYLKIGALYIQFMVIKQTFHQEPILSNFTRHTLNNLDDNQMLTKSSQHCFTWANTLGKSNFNIGLTLPITRQCKFTKYLKLKTHQQIFTSDNFKNILLIKSKVIKLAMWVIVKLVKLQLADFHNIYEITHEHITRLGKFDQSMHIIQKKKKGMQT